MGSIWVGMGDTVSARRAEGGGSAPGLAQVSGSRPDWARRAEELAGSQEELSYKPQTTSEEHKVKGGRERIR